MTSSPPPPSEEPPMSWEALALDVLADELRRLYPLAGKEEDHFGRPGDVQ